MSLIAASLNAGVILVVQCSDGYNLPLPRPPFPLPLFSPSLISLMVYVDIKHHVYLLAISKSGEVNSQTLDKYFDRDNYVNVVLNVHRNDKAY